MAKFFIIVTEEKGDLCNSVIVQFWTNYQIYMYIYVHIHKIYWHAACYIVIICISTVYKNKQLEHMCVCVCDVFLTLKDDVVYVDGAGKIQTALDTMFSNILPLGSL